MSATVRAYAIAVALWAIVVGSAPATSSAGGELAAPDLIERAAIGLLLLGFASSARLRTLLAVIGALRACLVLALLGLVLWGQILRDNRTSFPFLHWSMYTRSAPPTDYVDFEVRHRSGATGTFPFERLTSFSGSNFLRPRGRALETRVTSWVRAGDGSLAPAAARAELAKLVAIHNARHGDDPIVALTVVRRVVPLHGFTGRESVGREPLLELRFDE